MENGSTFDFYPPSLSCSDAQYLTRSSLPFTDPLQCAPNLPLLPFSPSSFSVSKTHSFFQSLESAIFAPFSGSLATPLASAGLRSAQGSPGKSFPQCLAPQLPQLQLHSGSPEPHTPCKPSPLTSAGGPAFTSMRAQVSLGLQSRRAAASLCSFLGPPAWPPSCF